MAFSRLNYETNAYNLQMKRSTEQGDYRLFPLHAEHECACYSSNGIVGAKSDVSLVKEHIELQNDKLLDIENKLSWRKHPLTNDNINVNPLNDNLLIHKKTCTNKLSPQDTRFTHPLDNYRCMDVIDYGFTPYLHVNPQCLIHEDRIGLMSRLHAKDNYISCAHRSWDSGNTLPQAKPEEQKKCLCIKDYEKNIPNMVPKFMLSPYACNY